MIDGCARCLLRGSQRRAVHLVEGDDKSEMVCAAHLEASVHWVGKGARVTPYGGTSPPAQALPDADQLPLF